jgi:hypothetical protein
MRFAMVGLVALVVASGCHAKFKKYAPTLGAVRPQVVSLAAPTVEIGTSGNVIVDAVNGVRAVDVAEKISRQVDLERARRPFRLQRPDGHLALEPQRHHRPPRQPGRR